MRDRDLDSDITAPLLLEELRDRYEIPASWDEEAARAVIGMRYELDLRGVTNLPTYTFIEDISDENLSAILELNTPGLMVESSTVREYHTTYAAHILGYTGGMDSSDWEYYKDLGYSMDAYIGQTGFEEAFEEYLHGIDGQRVDVVDRYGTTVASYWRNKQDPENPDAVYSPIAGNNVETTIDLDLQMVAEDALAEVMANITNPEINLEEGDNTGLDAEGAAVIVMEVKTGEILACASYPSYNLATMHEDWDEIEANPKKPFFNRAFGAYYAPGSTFKMCTLISAMQNTNSEGQLVYAPGEIIEDKGVFTKYAGFSPTCLIWSSNPGVTHQEIDGSQALMVSCNYFFYELGSRLTWQMIDATAKELGLGEPTGIEVTEKVGWRSNEESKKANYTGHNATYTAGDRVLSAIGQAENRFTPLQLCVYASTLANKGTRMKATFLSRVVSSDYETLITQNEPEIAHQMELNYQTVETYMSGMRKVITNDPELPYYNGTAASYFGGPRDEYGKGNGVWPMKNDVIVYAKTGTAEHSSGGSDHGAFLCFAHKAGDTEPEIAIALYGEKIAHGASLAPVAELILEAYFERVTTSDVFTYENQLG